jgi:hypothetical protein
MYDSGKVIAGIIIFLVLITFPLWYNLGSGSATKAPELEIGTKEKQCVESKEFMKASHMKLLNQWRDWVVRDGKRVYTSTTGKQYTMSLQNTCTKCHSSKEKFCDRCHNYVDASPKCWDCHIAPQEAKAQPLAQRSSN